MNHKDLKHLLDKIETDSMCRDEIFFDRDDGYKDRRIMFFKHMKKLMNHFDWYLECENKIMNTDYDNNDDDGFWGIVKSVNQNISKQLNNKLIEG